jgi:hypothetical protein
VSAIGPGGQAEALGLLKNDLIREINGLPVPSVQAIKPIFMKSAGELKSIKVVRGKRDLLLSRDEVAITKTQNPATVVDVADTDAMRQPLPPGMEMGRHSAPQQFHIGEVINGHVWSGKEWLPSHEVANDAVPSEAKTSAGCGSRTVTHPRVLCYQPHGATRQPLSDRSAPGSDCRRIDHRHVHVGR